MHCHPVVEPVAKYKLICKLQPLWPHRMSFAIMVIPDSFGMVECDPLIGVRLRVSIGHETRFQCEWTSRRIIWCETGSLTWTTADSCCGMDKFRRSKKKGESEKV